MKGLIIKDLYLFRGQVKTYVALFLFYVIYAIVARNVNMLFILIAILGINLVLSTFTVDSHCKWDVYALSTPIGRKKSVFSKYVTAILLVGTTTLVSLMLACIANAIIKEQPFTEILLMGYGLFAVTILIINLNMPLIYKLGAEKAKYVYIGELVIPAIIYLIGKDMVLAMPTEATIKGIFLMSPFIVIVLSMISIYISCVVYEKTEF